ncbi:MAG: hypothetical protein RJA07_2583 [Bacteroidota bacterium]|jgi:hypothetical protein
MKIKYVLLAGFFFFMVKKTEAQINDKFTDGNFSANPSWMGDTAKFDINALSQLQLNAPTISDTAFIASSNTMLDTTEWQFFTKLDFSPSTSNQLRVYLMSNQQNLKSSLNGYFIQMGTTGSVDSIEFFEQTGLIKTKIAGGVKGHCGKATNLLRIKVRRDLTGNFTLWSDTLGNNDFVQEFVVFDNTHTSTSYFGFDCIYSSTRSNKFYFDDVYVGKYIVDNTPPTVQQILMIDAKHIDVIFDESVQINSSQNVANYSVDNGIGGAITAIRDANNTSLVHLQFLNSFQNKNYNLSISNITDIAGNMMVGVVQPFSFYIPKQFDVVIDEIFADPSPSVGLPNYEFVEIKNTSTHTIDLFNWSFSDSSSFTQITSHFIIQPDSFAIVCALNAVSALQPYGNIVALTSLPSLNNDADILSLKDDKGKIIHSIFYSSNWYANAIKKNGGYSLEMIDTKNPCNGVNNWKASNDISGGTPGKKNSVDANNPDLISPKLIRIFPTTSNTLKLYFNETLDENVITNLTNFNVNQSVGNPTIAAFTDATRQIIALTFNLTFHAKKIYELDIKNITDCSGNLISDKLSFDFGMPEKMEAKDILINEILFNPKPYGSDFIELYNNSDKIIDVQKLYVSNATTTEQPIAEGYLFFPKTYIVLTESKDNISQNYTSTNPDGIIEVASLPSYDDANGKIILNDNASVLIDSLSYSDSWHYALLHDKEGVSLERISFDAKTQDENNWHSAASVVGFATPAYKNSQFITSQITDASISLQPKIFSPDNDGKDDVLLINYNLDAAGYSANISVFDAEGNLIKNISSLQTLEQQGFFQWDGTNNENGKTVKGIYVIYAEFFNTAGKKITLKKDCVVGGK